MSDGLHTKNTGGAVYTYIYIYIYMIVRSHTLWSVSVSGVLCTASSLTLTLTQHTQKHTLTLIGCCSLELLFSAVISMLYGIIKSLVCLFVLLTIPLSIAWTLQSPTRPPHARYLVALSLSFDSSERDELSIEDRNEAASQNVLEDDATSVSGTRGATKRRRLQSRPIRRDSTNSNLPMNRMQQERNEQIQKAQERYMEALKDPTLFANGSTQSNSNNSSHFDTIQPKISSATMRAIHEVLLLRQMTEIQCRTFPMAVQGASVLGRARTGTGKVCPSLVPFFVIGVSALFLTHVSHNIYVLFVCFKKDDCVLVTSD